jgi:hypothetical protein
MALQGFRRFVAALACVVVGAASFALSFVALRDVAVALEAVPASLGWLVPIVIDGGVICGSAVIWSLSREQSRRPVFPFLFVAALVIVSVVVNAAHAGPSPLAKLIAALPPLILLGTLELVAAQGRRLGTSPTVAPAARPASDVTGSVAQPPAVHTEPQVTVLVEAESFDAVSDLEAAVEEVFEPATWTTPAQADQSPAAQYTRSVPSRRKPTRVRAEQPLG